MKRCPKVFPATVSLAKTRSLSDSAHRGALASPRPKARPRARPKAPHKDGRNIPADKAPDLVYDYTIGLDMPRRDLQRAMGDQKKPWEIGKSFDMSAPIGPIHPVSQVGHFTAGAIWLKVNGNLKQNANLNRMIWNVAEQISQLSDAFELMSGDIIYSGTPANVGPVVRGDVIDCHIDRLPTLGIRIV